MKTISFQEDILPLKNMLFRIALRITMNREDAEDIVQETMIKCWNKRDSWQNIDSIEAFATTICRNLALDNNKRAAKGNKPLVQDHISAEPSPEARTMAKDSINAVERLIEKLPEKQKLCLQLRDFEEKSYKEIAEILQIPEPQVKINIFRARQTLREQFLTRENFKYEEFQGDN